MELLWEDLEVPEAPFFTRDLYDRFSLSPNIRELWAFLQSPEENANIKQTCSVGARKVWCPSIEEAAESKNSSSISKEESHGDSCDSDDACPDSAVESGEVRSKNGKKSREKLKEVENEVDASFPAPRLPYPCLSSLTVKEHKMYLDILMSKKPRITPQHLKAKVDCEVMDFMKYLQDVAQYCADDYNVISPGAMQYSEDLFKSCFEYIKTIPQLYQIHEMTSLTGGTFNPGLMLTFEKRLLIMGNVDITDHKIVPADAQLASDYQSVSSVNPPAKKAKDMHATISSDSNAEKLSAHYEPHVCLTRDALMRLLDNHGPDFEEQWEVPVWVKLNPGKGKGQKKTVYIDSPILKTEMTVRDRSHIYHEESLKLSVKKNGDKHVFHLMTELPANEQQPASESSQRNVVSFENDLDFEVDLTNLETFGETMPIKVSKMKEQDSFNNVKKATGSPSLSKTKRSSEHFGNTSSSSQEEMNSSLTDRDDAITKTSQPAMSETIELKTEQMNPDSGQESDKEQACMGDSDDEKLVIDDAMSPAATPSKPMPQSTLASVQPPHLRESEPVLRNSESSSPKKIKRRGRQSKTAKDSGDQLSEILRMQTAMFTSANDTAKFSTTSKDTNSPNPCMGSSVHPHPVSLVKPCVSSFLERHQNQSTESCTAPQETAPVINVTRGHKKILSQDLQAGAEDEQDYEAPKEGNLVYKLYSLQDLLLMVRSSVSLTHTRKVGDCENKNVPVYVLPKLEYQLCYGVECLSRSEACQLWAETSLHSSTVPYIAHINAHTSKVALVRKLPDDWIQNISCGFKPSKSLNILHHLLKKLTGLEQGRYLIAHKAGEPFVTLLKASNGKVTRGSYNLQQVHSSLPRPPASSFVPWIPVDPAVVLPFHQKHCRVPCTFPVTPMPKQKEKVGTPQANSQAAGQQRNNNAGGTAKKKKKKKRAARRNTYIKKLMQKSV